MLFDGEQFLDVSAYAGCQNVHDYNWLVLVKVAYGVELRKCICLAILTSGDMLYFDFIKLLIQGLKVFVVFVQPVVKYATFLLDLLHC